MRKQQAGTEEQQGRAPIMRNAILLDLPKFLLGIELSGLLGATVAHEHAGYA